MPDKQSAASAAGDSRFYREWSVIAVITVALLSLFTAKQWGQSLGLVLYDQFQRWCPAVPSHEIVLIAVDDATLQARGAWPLKRSDYTLLLKKLADSDNHPKVIGFDILLPNHTPEDEALAEQMRRHKVILVAEQSRAAPINASTTQPLNPVLSQAAQSMAHVNLSFEKDGSLRGAHLIDHGVPHIALAMSGLPQEPFRAGDNYRRIPMVHPGLGFPTASLADVLDNRVPLQFFKDKYVLIGSTAPSLGDHFPTLYSADQDAGTPGVMLHANTLNALLLDQVIQPVSMWTQIMLSWFSLFFALIALLVLSPLAELVVNVLVAVCTALISLALLVNKQLWFDPGLCLVAIALLKPIWSWRRSEMMVLLMSEGATQLDMVPRVRKTIFNKVRWHHFAGDTLLYYGRMLQNAIGTVNHRVQFLQNVIAQIPSAVLVTDDEGRILLSNPRMRQDLDAGLVQTGQHIALLLRHLGFPNADLSSLNGQDHYVSSLDTRGIVSHHIMRLASIEQTTERSLWVLSLADISEVRQFQAQRDLTLQLLSHDMRTPLAAIIALSSQISGAGHTSAAAPAHIQRHARALLDMMDDFIISIQAQSARYRLQEILLDDLVDEAIYQVQDLARIERMHIRQVLDGQNHFIMADQRLLTRVLVNLLVNAIRYGKPDTEIVIEISHEPSHTPSRRCVHCTVGNTVGDQSVVRQAQFSTGNSFGLGLAFVQTVVRKHDGHIHTELPKTPGAQARVRISLPLVLTDPGQIVT